MQDKKGKEPKAKTPRKPSAKKATKVAEPAVSAEVSKEPEAVKDKAAQAEKA